MLDGVGSSWINYCFVCKLAILINITSVIILCNWMIRKHSTHLSLLYWCPIEFVINCGFFGVLNIDTHTYTLHWAYYNSPLIDRKLFACLYRCGILTTTSYWTFILLTQQNGTSTITTRYRTAKYLLKLISWF